jgi:hypothetical protein
MNRYQFDPFFRLALIGILVFLLLPVNPARADIGVKPSMSFRFEFQIPKVDILQGDLIECEDAECKTGQPLQQLGPQGFKCTIDTCSATAYGFKDYHKLVIQFTDRSRESNIFSTKQKSSIFKVSVTSDKLVVEEVPSTGSLCQVAGILTIVVEMLFASLYLSAFGLPRLVLGWVPVASLVTLPFIWSVFPLLIVPGIILTVVSEVFAVGVETFFLHRVTSKALSLHHTFWLSLVMNAASFGVGLWIYIW